MEKIRIAQVGTAHMTHAVQTFRSLLRQRDAFEVVALAEPDEARRGIARTAPWSSVPLQTVDELLARDDLDAVAIETDELTSTRYAQLFADRGIHVHLEKPGSPDVAAFERLVGTLRAKGLVFHMGYMYRYNPAVGQVLSLIRDGALGDLFSVEAQMSVRYNRAEREWISRFPGGMMFYLGCHLVDLLLLLMGEPDEILPFNAATGEDGLSSVDYGFALFRYPRGVSFAKTCAAEHNGFDRRQVVVCGSRGTVEIRPTELILPDGSLQTTWRTTLRDAAGTARAYADASETATTPPFDRYDAMMRAFAEMIRGERANPWGYDYETRVFRALEKACGGF